MVWTSPYEKKDHEDFPLTMKSHVYGKDEWKKGGPVRLSHVLATVCVCSISVKIIVPLCGSQVQ